MLLTIYTSRNNENSVFRNRNSWRVTAYKILLKKVVKMQVFFKKMAFREIAIIRFIHKFSIKFVNLRSILN